MSGKHKEKIKDFMFMEQNTGKDLSFYIKLQYEDFKILLL